MKYSNRDQFINFIKESRCDSMTDLASYRDFYFCKLLKLICLEDISLILFTIQNDHVAANKAKKQFNLANALNIPKKDTHLNIMDYCLAAGLDDLAFKFTVLGAKSENMDILKDNLEKHYNGEVDTPYLVMNIQLIIKKLQQDFEEQDSKEVAAASSPSFFKKHAETLQLMFKSHKFPLLLLILGITCCIASIFVPVATPILLAIGIPAVVASVGSYQNAYNAVTNSIQLDNIAQFMHETNNIDSLIKKCKKLKESIMHDKKSQRSSSLYSMRNHEDKHADPQHESRLLLHKYNSKDYLTEVIKREPAVRMTIG
jgi:hypothetical protein